MTSRSREGIIPLPSVLAKPPLELWALQLGKHEPDPTPTTLPLLLVSHSFQIPAPRDWERWKQIIYTAIPHYSRVFLANLSQLLHVLTWHVQRQGSESAP